MIAGKIKGRLGNQLFTIATLSSLAQDNNSQCVFTLGTESCTLPDIADQKEWYDTILRRISYTMDFSFATSYYKEESPHYKELPFIDNTLYDGLFQSPKYFVHNRDYILDLFSLSDTHQESLHNSHSYLFDSSEKYISVHVRRGDYLSLDNHPVCTHDYYNRSLSFFNSSMSVVVFSDDIKWCEENLKFSRPTFFIKNLSAVDGLYLMSQCSHHIIVNSSFSWWGSFLNTNPHKQIIAPKIWIKNDVRPDIYCPEWTVL